MILLFIRENFLKERLCKTYLEEANEKIDRGDDYSQDKIEFEGHEIFDEIR